MASDRPGPRDYPEGRYPYDPMDPILNPALFEDVPARRVLAFMIDVVIIVLPVIFVMMFIFVFGLVTFGLGWALFLLVTPGTIVWAIFYYGITMGGPASATIGMRAVDLTIRTSYGAPCSFLIGAIHGAAFWVLTTSLTPLVLLVALFNERRQLLHDMLLGTVVVNNERRVADLYRYGWSAANRL